MLNKETEDKLKVLGIDVSKLTEAVKADDEVSLEVPTLYTEEQKNSFGSNRFAEGKTAMSEILAKDVKKKLGIEAETKDIFQVIEIFGENKVKELGKPNEMLEVLKKEKEALQGKVTELTGLNEKTQKEFNDKLFGVELKAQLSTIIPESTKIPKEDITTLFLNTYRVSKDDTGRTVVFKGNEVLKDSLLNPLELKTVLNTFIDEKKLIQKSGMGGEDRGGGSASKFTNMSEFMTYCEKNQIEPMGKEGQAMLSANKAENFSYKS